MRNVDLQRIKEIRDNTRAMAEAFGRIADTLAEALELFIATQTETQNSNSTFEKDECAKEYEELGLKELKELIKADSKDEPQTDRLVQTNVIELPDAHQKVVFEREITEEDDCIKFGKWKYKGFEEE